ncbi:antibiotic ABC transporter permease [Halomicroarcula sp. GCM10025709]|uniref:antibiotic ABC transporter permease n=1 Tax=Haloarcula TaxID=2237 RepID=UPI0024C28A29|nr:antibiotic ABC transporter permease [Halomicroarcula sp. YJ-61-S]
MRVDSLLSLGDLRQRVGTGGGTDTPDDHGIQSWLAATLRYARDREYTGWDYGDGMDNRVREALPVDSKWVNIGFQELVKRCPVNVRPLLGVRQRRNYQGAALFAMANRTMADLTGDEMYAREARALADWLVENQIEGYSGYCAGYPHPIQHLDGRGDPGEPDIINTSFGAKALLRAAADDERYAAVVADADRFVVEDLQFQPPDSGRGAVIDYHTKHPQDYYTINAGAMGARLLLDLYAYFGNREYRQRAEALLDHIAALQTDCGGWMYRDPPEASHLSMDTHHNGFVVEGFQRHREVTDTDRYAETVDDALAFVRRDLIEPDGAPNFDEAASYPRDIHASTQLALVFTYAGDLERARRALQWVFENLAAGDGRFYYRKERYFTRRVTLMRWCQAWMSFAMSEYLAAEAR